MAGRDRYRYTLSFMRWGSARVRRRAGRIAGGTIGAAFLVVVVWRVPAALYPAGGQPRATVQAGMLAVAAAAVALTGVRITVLETRRANDREHVRELYGQAIVQLGSDTLDIRLGGIYALERLANDSPTDQPTIVAVLCAFVREHTIVGRPGALRRGRPAARLPTPAERARNTPAPTVAAGGLDTDLQAALTVLSHLPTRGGGVGADLTDAQLTGAVLVGANLADADLSGANLTNAILYEDFNALANLTNAQLNEANLTGARMVGANLTGAGLVRADLTGTELSGATLADANLAGANLTDAVLYNADLSRAWLVLATLTHANLSGANLTGGQLNEANLTGARLHEANLTGARLHGADLTGARDLTQGQVDAADGDGATRLPAGLARPVSWPSTIGPRTEIRKVR